MDFARSFTFVFEDPDWIKKVALIALISIIPVVGMLVALGWGLDAGRRLIRRTTPLLPELDFGGQLTLGFQSFVIGLVYAIPTLILALPLMFLPLIATSSSDQNASSALAGAASIVSLCCIGLLALYGLLMLVLIPAAHGNFLATGRLSSAFKFNEIFGLLRAAPGAYLLVLLGGVLGGIIGPLGGIACVVGALLTSAYVMVAMGHLYAQAYLAALTNGALQ